MMRSFAFPKQMAAVFVYMRPILVFGGMLCAIAVMWTRNPAFYTSGVLLLLVSMGFDVVDGWFAARFHPYPTLAQLTDRIMDKVVYSIIFPLIAAGAMWRLIFVSSNYSRSELLHAIFLLMVCVTVLIRDNFAHFTLRAAMRQGQEPEASELNRLRTIVAAPVGVLLYAYVFYVPDSPPDWTYSFVWRFGEIPLRVLLLVEIIFLVINFGSIAGYCRKYGAYCLDELCLGDPILRRRILTFFPNALTVMNAMMGLLSVFFAYQGRMREAYVILSGAAIFDKLDGALARKLGLTGEQRADDASNRISMGGVLDDISDAISFCIVPAWIFYLFLSETQDPVLQRLPIGLCACLYGALGAARLVYFTLDRNPIPGFFKGLPTPAAALLVTAPLIMYEQALDGSPADLRFWGLFCFGLMFAASLLMNIYSIRYIHYGRFMNRHPVFITINLMIAVLFVFTKYFGYFSICCMFIYLISPLWTWRIDPAVAARETRYKKTL